MQKDNDVGDTGDGCYRGGRSGVRNKKKTNALFKKNNIIK